jgi:hypothetical protein
MALNKFGEYLLRAAAEKVKEHLLSENCDKWLSGYVSQADIEFIESKTNRKVDCSPESGEYFYRLGTKIK